MIMSQRSVNRVPTVQGKQGRHREFEKDCQNTGNFLILEVKDIATFAAKSLSQKKSVMENTVFVWKKIAKAHVISWFERHLPLNFSIPRTECVYQVSLHMKHPQITEIGNRENLLLDRGKTPAKTQWIWIYLSGDPGRVEVMTLHTGTSVMAEEWQIMTEHHVRSD